jgi:hypothetical protein
VIIGSPIHVPVEEDHAEESESEPLDLVGPPARFVEDPCSGRLVRPLRDAAETQDPAGILARAACAFHAEDETFATALADLAVTGREAFRRFSRELPDERSVVARAEARLAAAGVGAAEADVARAATFVLDRAYRVATVLRGPPGAAARARRGLGWIAVSGEDDPPHRPVNVASAPYPQHTVQVSVGGATVETRFFVATEEGGHASSEKPYSRVLPRESRPEIPDDHRVILFLHGHSSRAEEALDIVRPLLEAGRARGQRFAIVSFDLPSNGYSSMLEHTEVAKSHLTSFPAGIFDRGRVQTPLLDFLEEFVVAFVDALDEVVPIKHRFAGVIGGSLGGNLGLRLGRRDLVACPWLSSGIVSWAAASVWAPMVEDVIKRRAPEHCRESWDQAEDEGRRRAYFDEVFDQVVFPVFIHHTVPSMWYRSGWEPHKARRIARTRRERYEIYGARFRRWHWRVAGEQLIYSHLDRVDRTSASSPHRHALNRVRHLLVAGAEDDYPGSNIYSATRHLASRMVDTPGRSLFLLRTGHSIHAERPRFLAGQIAHFLTEEASPA